KRPPGAQRAAVGRRRRADPPHLARADPVPPAPLRALGRGVHLLQVPHDDRRRGVDAPGARGAQRGRRPGLQDPRRSTRHARGPVPAAIEHRRAPAALERAARRHEHRRSAPAAARGGRALPPARLPAPGGHARAHLPLADQGTLADQVRRVGATRPRVHPPAQLLARRRDRAAHDPGGAERAGRGVRGEALRRTLARWQVGGESRRILLASLGSLGATLAIQLCLLTSGPLVARMLGVDGRGYLAGLTLWPLLISLLGGLGVPVGCTYFLSQRPADRRRILGEVYRIALVQGAVLTALAALVLLAWSSGRPPEVRTAVYPLLALLPAMLAHQYAMRLLPTALYAAAVAALFLTGHRSLLPVATVSALAFALPAAVSTTLALARERPDWRPIAGFRRELLAFSLRGHLGAVSPVDSLRVDQAAVA